MLTIDVIGATILISVTILLIYDTYKMQKQYNEIKKEIDKKKIEMNIIKQCYKNE